MAAPAVSASTEVDATSTGPRKYLRITNCPPIYQSVADLNSHGKFGEFGGRYIPETLMAAHEELERVYVACTQDPVWREEFELLGRDFIGRETPLYFARRLTETLGGAQIYLKREELAHTGSHKLNNALGQALIAKRIGKKRIIAETGAGQHGVATATACALLGLDCVVYMGEEDVRRQALNVFRMKMLGAEVIPVTSGSKTLKDAINEAMRCVAFLLWENSLQACADCFLPPPRSDWVTNVTTTHYIIGTATGPHPFPTIVRDLQAVIGREARAQMLEQAGRLPDVVVACSGFICACPPLRHLAACPSRAVPCSRRRQQRDRPLLGLPRGRGRAPRRCRGRRLRRGDGLPRRDAHGGPPGRPARHEDVPAAGALNVG